MRGNGYENHYKDIPPPKEGLRYQTGQLTPLARNKSKIGVNCDYCGMAFEKYACWAKRTAHHYCGRSCANAAKLVRIPKPCAVCNGEMLLTPADYPKISTCSKTCLRKKRVKNNMNLRSSADYKRIVSRLKKNQICKVCATKSGPWTVRNIKTWVHDGLSCADGSDAYLVCRHCHLKEVSPLSLTSTYITDRFRYYKDKYEMPPVQSTD